MTYNAYVTTIKNVKKHSNADRLLLGECFGNQVVVGLDTKDGDIGVYYPCDGRLSIEFMEANNLIGKIDQTTGQRTGGFFDEKGKVRAQKFRGEKSDGYFCPLSFLSYTGVDISTLTEGTIVNEVNGHKICEKYITERTFHIKEKKVKPLEKVKFPLFHEHIDTEQLAYNLSEIKKGMTLIFTEKLHGTSGRSSYSLAVTHSRLGLFINNLFKREVIAPSREWKYVFGSRHVVYKNGIQDGWYGSDEIVRAQAHELFVDKLHKGETVYYEIVGYLPSGKPIMAVGNNEKLGKDFVKKYGKTTTFSYGCQSGQHDVYVYRITTTNEDGDIVDYTQDQIERRCAELGVKSVPVIHKEIVTTNAEWVLSEAKAYAQGESTITPAHVREGVVVRVDSSRWQAWKNKSFEFKVIESIIKDTDVVDMEESS